MSFFKKLLGSRDPASIDPLATERGVIHDLIAEDKARMEGGVPGLSAILMCLNYLRRSAMRTVRASHAMWKFWCVNSWNGISVWLSLNPGILPIILIWMRNGGRSGIRCFCWERCFSVC